MLGKKMVCIRKLARKVKVVNPCPDPSQHACLVVRSEDHHDEGFSNNRSGKNSTPTGFFAVYVGEERKRFVVPTGYLSHPLFKMLLEKASDEFGFDQKNGLVVPCSVSTFQEVLNAVECCNGRFDFGNLVEEFI